MWRWCSQIASDYIEFSFDPLRPVSAPPPPPPQLRPLFSESSLSPPLLIRTWYTGVSQNNFLWQKSLAPQLPINPFQSPFSLLLYSRTFFAIPLAEKMHSLFSASHRESFSRFLLHHDFYSFLINVPIIHIEGFRNLPVNPALRVPGFMEEKGR